MRLIGLAGPARAGKDTVADYLVGKYGFKKFSFSDRLYEEVAAAFEIDPSELNDPLTKDQPTICLADCLDRAFYDVAHKKVCEEVINVAGFQVWTGHVSPRFLLQTWGTEYRRAQDPDYWIKCAKRWVVRQLTDALPSLYTVKIVNTSVRYPNEAQWIRESGGFMWHVTRDECPVVRAHSSEIPVPKSVNDVTLKNHSSREALYQQVDEAVRYYE